MISRESIDGGAVLFVIVACVISWFFGAMCGAAAMLGLDDARPLRDNRPAAASGAIPKTL